ncbi:MAG: glutaminyl-peptide cyclotransferase [Prevotellaceae bacterium]|jgi:glutamine cyclotransferase|nr:glutaminyl-peptide cyclotransferase [Prevotellaceae bacterium]
MLKKTLCFLLIFAVATAAAPTRPPKQYTYKVVKSYPHDRNAYTQGLFFHEGILYESSGQYGSSGLRKSNPATGQVLQALNIPHRYFAEGACVLRNRLYLLTWQEHTCFVYDARTFKQLGTFQYPTQGWGLTTNGTQLIMSDGSATLYFRHPDTFAEQRRITVRNGGKPVQYLNELEYIDGEIWANVYTTDLMLRIDPADGTVTGVVDLSNLLPRSLRTPKTDVLNGIAYDGATARLFVTGKNWPKLYEIAVEEKK